jgi:thymidine kinase
MWPNNRIAYLDLILGPMFSGKTSRLIEVYNYCIKNNISVIAINHSLDTRFGNNVITTHDSKNIPCIQVEKLNDIFNNEEFSKKLCESNVVLINEGQFFEDLFQFVVHILEKKFKQIHVCGLDGDFQRNKFGQILDLIPYCDNVTKYKAVCKNCPLGELALFSFRISNESEQTCVGIQNYTPLCRQCYNTIILNIEQ